MYFSQRIKSVKEERQPLDKGFWFAFNETLEAFANQNYFCEKFPSYCNDDHPLFWYPPVVKKALQADFGLFEWPRKEDNPPNENQILDLVEFFFKHISVPQETWFHSYCGEKHPTNGYDQRKGRYEYTIKVNQLFARFHQPFKLQKGHIIRQSSAVLDELLVETDIGLPIEDAHLVQLIATGLEHFYKSKGNNKMDGLRCMVDAFERIKSMENPKNKKESVKKTIDQISISDGMTTHLNEMFRELTRIANENTIRHHELDKQVINDEATIEFLFYSYYNAIRFLLTKPIQSAAFKVEN